jgi:hypothetical protein
MKMKLAITTRSFCSTVFVLGLLTACGFARADGADGVNHVTAPASSVTTTTTTTSTTSSNLTPDAAPLRSQPIEETVRRSIELKDTDLQPERIRTDEKLAKRLAKSHWLEKAAAEDPEIIAAITQYPASAKILARHPRLGHIAEYDHYLCRQLTKWKDASRVLAKNPQAQGVIYYDPEGIYRAIKVDKGTARRLSRNTEFAQMVIDNPDLAKVLASYM